MKGKLKIDVSEFVEDLDALGESIIGDIQEKVRNFSRAVYNEALRLSTQRLGASAMQWQNNLKYEEAGKNVYVIYLIEDSSAIPIEEGYGSFDMKPGFLNSGLVKRNKKGGKYLNIPIQQHHTRRTPSTKKIVDMRSAVASVLRDKTVEKRIEEYNTQAKGLAKFGKITKYVNVPDPRAEGLVRVEPPGKKGSRYYIFRRVSQNSPKDKWIHPGFRGANIFGDLEQYVENGIADIIKGTIG